MQRHEVPGDGRYLTCSCRARLRLFNNDAIQGRLRRASRIRSAPLQLPPHRMGGHARARPYSPAPGPRHRHRAADSSHNVKGAFARRVIDRWKALDAPSLARLADPKGICRFWEVGGGYDRNIRLRHELLEKVIHRNPVSGVWSTARRTGRGLRRGGRPVIAQVSRSSRRFEGLCTARRRAGRAVAPLLRHLYIPYTALIFPSRYFRNGSAVSGLPVTRWHSSAALYRLPCRWMFSRSHSRSGPNSPAFI